MHLDFWHQLPGLLLALLPLLVTYLACLYLYRLFLHPLSKFPGPKLAAATNWYEFYYDVIQQGAFTAHIQDLHKRYGPIIRITPHELHIDDPDYYSTLYERAGRRDKYAYFSGRFGYASDLFSTIDHDVHRLRRKPVAAMFSAKRISDFQPVIRAKVDKLCARLAGYRASGEVVNLKRAWMALTTDVITEYAFAQSYGQLDVPGFTETLNDALVAIYTVGQLALHFSIIFPVLDMLPDWFTLRAEPRLQPVVGMRKDLAAKVREIRDGLNQGHKQAAHPTVFHELLNSDLPPSEKTDARLGDEAQLIVAAGLITTSRALEVASYHLIANPEMPARLRAELREAGLAPSTDGGAKQQLDWHRLEALPYLNGVVHEAIRLAHGISTRSPRLAPDQELQYAAYAIPPNTPVSMTAVDILMNDKVYPAPRSFRPERWVDNPGLDKYFVPFAKGSRQCLGLNLAQAELYIAIAKVFSTFDFELVDTDVSDIEMRHAYLVPYPKWDSEGVQAKVKPDGKAG